MASNGPETTVPRPTLESGAVRRAKLRESAARQRKAARHYSALAREATAVADRIIYEECARRALDEAEALDRRARGNGPI